MDALTGFINFLVQEVFSKPAYLVGLMTAVGLSFIFRGIAQQDYINGSAQKNWPIT